MGGFFFKSFAQAPCSCDDDRVLTSLHVLQSNEENGLTVRFRIHIDVLSCVACRLVVSHRVKTLLEA